MKTKVLMVCLGNICRSPLAEGILKSKVNPDQVLVDSAGTTGYHEGNSPDERSITVGHKFGIDISKQRSRKFTKQDFINFDIIYVMDKSNYSNIIGLTNNKEYQKKVRLLLDCVDLNENEVPDPYYDNDGFEHVYHLIDEACEFIAKKIN
ncbi:MAG: low molecular weight protein-tyrosine-phosphatase [Cellulophaga sp.]